MSQIKINLIYTIIKFNKKMITIQSTLSITFERLKCELNRN